MPKILTDVQSNILTTAKKLLLTEGYHKMSMRELAKKCNIAVGTVYNYYDSKLILCANLIDVDWKIALDNMSLEVKTATSVQEGLEGIYQEIKNFAMIYKPFWASVTDDDMNRSDLQKYRPLLIDLIDQQIQDLFERFDHHEDEQYVRALAELLMVTAVYSQIEKSDITMLISRLI